MGSILWRLLCSNRLNIQPKLQGGCPDLAQLCGADDIKKYIHESGITKASLVSLCRNLFDPLFLAPPFIATAINQSIYSLQQSYLIFQEMKAYNRATVSTISLHNVYVHKNNSRAYWVAYKNLITFSWWWSGNLNKCHKS